MNLALIYIGSACAVGCLKYYYYMSDKDKIQFLLELQSPAQTPRGTMTHFIDRFKSKGEEGVQEIEEEKFVDENVDIIFENLDEERLPHFKEAQMRNEVFVYKEAAETEEDEEDEEDEQRISAFRRTNTTAGIQALKDVLEHVRPQLKKALEERREKESGGGDNEKEIKTVFDLMELLKVKRTWKYVKVLIQFLKKKGPFWYSKRPGFYDSLAEALIYMNKESVDGLVDIYNLTTVWPQDILTNVPKFSRLKTDSEEMIRGQGLKQSLYNKYCECEGQLKREPQGTYVNEARIAAWAVPMEMAYGSKKSLEFLESLDECKDNNVFKVPVVQGYLNYKWDQARYYLLGETIAHVIFLISFNVLAVNVDARHNLGAEIFTTIFAAIFVFREAMQIISLKLSYFFDPWNYPDVGMLVFSFLAIYLPTEDQNAISWFYMLTVLLQWIRLVSYFRIWGRTRHLIRAITETISDMIPFLCVLLMLIFCFTSAWLACFPEDELKDLYYKDFLFSGYNVILGNPPDVETNTREYIVFVVITLGGLIVLVNMLIAIMGDTFSRVQSNAIVYDYRERLRVIIDLESVMLICNYRKSHRLNIGVIRRPNGFEDEQAEWEGGYTELKKITKDNFKKLNKKIDRELKYLQTRLEQKFDKIGNSEL